MTAAFTVGTLNIWGRWADWPARRAALASCFPQPGPDVLLLQEVRHDALGDQAEELAELLGYPEQVTVEGHRNDDGSEGLAMLSRLPLTGVHHEALPTSDPPRKVIVASIACAEESVTIVCGHTVAVPEHVRQEQVEAFLKRAGERVVLGADLNDTPDRVAPLLAEAALTDALDGHEAPTWPMNEQTFGTAWRETLGHAPQFSLERRRLDYLLSRGLEVQAAGVDELQCDGGPHASDHALVWARYGLAGASR
ncbi:MAG TPA: endonuclease/exonuclease/phosphatase family protein [Solirubrobacteraceae bacterium]|nr:endonuclease/exonuclease/phosphatase family protein [Solirubrobacteraceae bacterium]